MPKIKYLLILRADGDHFLLDGYAYVLEQYTGKTRL